MDIPTHSGRAGNYITFPDKQSCMGGGAFDEEILKTAVRRREVLATLSDGPHHRHELQEEFDISKTTCHRIIRTFDENGLLRRTDRGYALTTKGDLLGTYVDEYYRKVRTIFRLEPLVTAFEKVDVEFDIEAFTDARITRPDPNDSTLPLNREFELFQEADYFSVIDSNQHIPMLYLKRVFEIGIEQGMRGEYIAPRSVIEKRLSEFPEVHQKHTEVEADLKYRVCERPTFGLTLYDQEHVVMRAYDDNTGSIELMVDTNDRDAVTWADDVIDHYREKADPPSAFEELPEWTPDADIDF